MSIVKEEYLAALMNTQNAYTMLLEGADLVKVGGVSGIQTTAERSPELILFAIDQLAQLLIQTREEHLLLVEQYFQLQDALDELK